MKSKVVANSVIIMVLLGLLTTVALLTLSPWYMFGLGRPPVLKIAVCGSNGLAEAVEAAVNDINLSVHDLSPQPPNVKAMKATEYKRLSEVDVFMAAFEADLQPFRGLDETSKATFVALEVLPEAKGQKGHVYRPNMDVEQEMLAFLAVMASNNPSNKTLEVVPVWENNGQAKWLYDLYLAEVEANFRGRLKFTLPVTYEASKYPKSDGMQAVSEIGSRLALHPGAHIFFLTASRLRDVIDSASMNRDLTQNGRRWYARGLLDFGPTLEAVEAVHELCRATSLTTVTFMASDDSAASIELLRRAMEHDHRSAMTYVKALTYATVNELHKAFTASILSQRPLRSFLKNSQTVITASLTFNGLQPNMLPLRNWMVTSLIHVKKGEQPRSEAVLTHPLQKSQFSDLQACQQPQVSLWLHPSIIYPYYKLEFANLEAMPDLMILPAQQGISASLKCTSETTEATIMTTVHCVPRKFNQGELICKLETNSEEAEAAIKAKRSVGDFVEAVDRHVRPIWSGITPDVFSCTASVAGCDFCFYYLATYNLSVAPAACVGGCSLGTFGSCTKLVANSLVKTLDLTKSATK